MSALLESSSSAGLDADSGPLWFKPEKFLDPKFNPEAYVNDLKRYVPLDTLNATLAEHAEALRARLVEVVNDDYDEFVSLSTKLVDVDGAVARLAAPLAEVRARVEAARAAVAAQADALQEGLARRQAAAAARALLELAQDAVHAAAKVDKLLEELAADKAAAAAAGGASEGDAAAREAAQEALEGRASLLDRACSEVSRLHFFAARGQELAVVRAMAPRVERASAALRGELDAALAATLAAQNPAALGVLLHAYGSLGAPKAAEAVVRSQTVAPVVAAAVAGAREAAAAGTDAALPPPAPTLAAVLPAVEAALREQTGPFLELALTTGGGAAAFDFMGGAVLPEALAAAEAACPGCYSPGLPEAFHANYLASAAFLAALEGLCATPAQVERLRDSPAATAHRKKWNLAAYFSLQFQNVAGELEEALRGAGLSAVGEKASAAEGGPSFGFAATAATWRALESCVDPATFLPPLADRFLRLALQAAARAATWAEDGAAAAEAAGVAAPAQSAAAGEGGGDAQAQQQEQQDDGGDDGSKPWGAEATAEQLAALSHDFTALQAALSSHLLPRFEALVMPAGGAAAGEALAAAFDETEARLGAAAGAVIGAAASRLVARCCEALRQLRGIVATFRMTSRGAPTRPAQYAGAILAPLGQFLAGPGAGLGEPARCALAAAVVAGVAERYAALAHDTLSTVRKTESSLRRLKFRKAPGAEAGGEAGAGAAAGAEQLGTDDLIALQLRLDFDEFGRRVVECGVDPAALPAVAALRGVLDAPEDK